MTDSLTTLLDTARRIADTDLYPTRCRSVIADLADALQTASTGLTESREYALALEREIADRAAKQDALTAMAVSMDADFQAAPDATYVGALREALEAMLQSVCGPTGFAEAVRHNSGRAYPWHSLEHTEEIAHTALAAKPQAAPVRVVTVEQLERFANTAQHSGLQIMAKALRAIIAGQP